MSALTGSIAHEISQPLNSILHNTMAAELLLKADQPSRDELTEILREIRSEDDRVNQIVQRYRAMLQKRELDRRPLDLHALVRDSLAFLAHDAAQRHIDVDASVPDGPCVVNGDQVLLQQVIVNLVTNAMDAMADTPIGSRRLVVSAQADPRAVTVSVRDHGGGLSPEVERRLFDPFVTTKAEGIGIGLTIVRSIIAAHQGTIEGRNNSDGGATFQFALPAATGR
jgi:C4-dicarboxylate-specific signal transduction histidine kinase